MIHHRPLLGGLCPQNRPGTGQTGPARGGAGCYINPVHPDDAARAAEVARFVERLRYAKHCGADMVGTETGRFSPDMSVTDATYGRVLQHPAGQLFHHRGRRRTAGRDGGGGERVQPHPAHPRNDGPLPQGHRLPGGGGHSGRRQPGGPLGRCAGRAERLINKAFDLYGDRISVLHLKDCVFDEQGVQKCVRPGTGLVCYDALMANIKHPSRRSSAFWRNPTPNILPRTARSLPGSWKR